MKSAVQCPVRAGLQRGLSLIELMIALLLSSLLVAGMIQVFLASKISYSVQSAQASLHENGRFAVEFLARDVRMAGLLSCGSRLPRIHSLLNSSTFPFDFVDGGEFIPVRGFEFTGTAPGSDYVLSATPSIGAASAWQPTLPTGLAGQVAAGSDVVLIRRASPTSGRVECWPGQAGCGPGQQIRVSEWDDYRIGDIVMVGDCQQAAIWQVTGTNETQRQLVGSAAGSLSPGNRAPGITNQGPGGQFGQGAEVTRFETAAYFVGIDAAGNRALMRSIMRVSGGAAAMSAPEEIAGGVDTMQVLYGIDTTNSRSVDAYVAAAEVTDWSQVIALRIAMMVATEETSPGAQAQTLRLAGTDVIGPDDRRDRRAFTATVTLRNRLN